MKELIDRQEAIKHIGDCLDKNGYVDTTKFAKCMREILNMPYDTKEAINNKAIDEFAVRLNLKFVKLPLDDLIVTDILKNINIVAKQIKGE